MNTLAAIIFGWHAILLFAAVIVFALAFWPVTSTRPLIALGLALFAASFLISCTPSQMIANGNYVAGAQLATYALGQRPGSVPALKMLAKELPNLVIGKTPPRKAGQLNAMLEPIFQEAGQAQPDDKSVFVKIGSLISAASHMSGGNPTIYQGVAMAAAQDFANGIQDSIAFNAGRHDVTDPPAVQAATARKAAIHR